MAFRFRDLARFLLPGNYTEEGTDGEKITYSLTRLVDAFYDIDRAGLEARFPSLAGDSALALIGGDRQIPRGRAEASANYAQRLIAWRYPRGHRVRGNAFALLEQISAYFGGGFKLSTVDTHPLQYVREADGTESAATYGPPWDWDGPVAFGRWARFWIFVDGTNLITPTPDYGDPALYGGSLGNTAYALGHGGVSADDVNAIRRLFRGRSWNPAGTRAEWAIVSFDGSDPAPDGTWGRWSKDDGTGNYVAARDPAFRYWALSPSVNVYSGDPTLCPTSAYVAALGSPYAGEPSSFPLTCTTGAGTYGGDPTKFALSAKLVDDGSIP